MSKKEKWIPYKEKWSERWKPHPKICKNCGILINKDICDCCHTDNTRYGTNPRYYDDAT
ncbi:unnamed protein product, partial [marine sediment metagenome]